jgi:sensor histidine kinase YesM
MNSTFAVTRQYLLAQCLFWGLYAVFNLILFGLFSGLRPLTVIITLKLSLASALMSHLLRYGYKRWFHQWSLTRVIAVVLLVLPLSALLVQVFLQFSTYILLNIFSSLSESAYKGSSSLTLMYVLNLTIILGFWLALYMSVDQFRRRRVAEVAHWRAQAQLNEAELQFLRSQINSHFMFNALNNLRALIREDPELARDRLTQLAALLRAILQTGQQDTMPLEKELDIVRGYLDLESLQFEDRLQVEWHIDPSLLSIAVPTLLLQTLAENAVKHGIACRREGGKIVINAKRQDDRLYIMISNPLPEYDAKVEGTGLGLDNTRRRLQRLYGVKAKLALRRSSAEMIAEVEIPL